MYGKIPVLLLLGVVTTSSEVETLRGQSEVVLKSAISPRKWPFLSRDYGMLRAAK